MEEGQPEIKIPPGYTPIEKWEEAHPEQRVEAKKIRFLRHNLMYVFDSDSPEYNQFLEKCRQESKFLEKALRKELRERKIPVWTARRARPEYAKNYHRMSFLIRPPYFTTYRDLEKGPENRLQNNPNCDNFILHFDENWVLQTVRSWRKSKVYRIILSNKIHENIEGINKESRGGNYHFLAKAIADALQDPLVQILLDESFK